MMKPRTDLQITHAQLLALVRYDPETGHFTSLVRRQGVRKDRPLGSVEPNGYRRLRLAGTRYMADRLAWFYMTGAWPEVTVDHRDLNRANDRWGNLREATHSQQHANTRGQMPPGLKGAHWNRFRGHWQSYIKVNGKSLFLGRFETPEEAHRAYVAAATRIHGEYARAA